MRLTISLATLLELGQTSLNLRENDESEGEVMKRLLMIAIAATLCGCDTGYDRHPEVLAAMRDPLFDQWLKRNKLELIHTYESCGCTCLQVAFVGGKGKEVK